MRFGGLLFILLCLIGCTTRGVPVPDAPHFSLLTFNVNMGMPGAEVSVVAIERADADLVCLQETTPAWEALLRERLRERYPHMAFRYVEHMGRGLAVLSKFPLSNERQIEPASGWFPAQGFEVQTAVGLVQMLNVHHRQPTDRTGKFGPTWLFRTISERRADMAVFAATLRPETQTVVVGDFNEGPMGAAVDWLEDRGYESVLPKFDRQSETCRTWYHGVTLKTRIDHVMVAKLEAWDARVIREGGSDHWPIRVVLGKE
jgi:endonuclease/exonuclease/phosphatase (EEP) superfamily protein YafD